MTDLADSAIWLAVASTGAPIGASCRRAAITPPCLCGTPARRKPHFYAAQRPGQHEVVEAAEMADSKYSTRELG